LRFTGFKTKESKTEKELVQRINIELLQGLMMLHAKVVATMRQRLVVAWASTLATGACPGAVLLKFATSEDCPAVLRGCKGLVGTKLGLDEDLMPVQQACKSEMWPMFKEAKAMGKCTFWCTAKLFVNGTQICSSFSV
jgi:hypothetical protein